MRRSKILNRIPLVLGIGTEIESSDSRHVQEPADTLGSWRQTSNSVHSNCLLACVAGLNNLHLLWRNVIFQLHGTMAGKKQHGFSVVGSTLRSE
jgi:hypothetical protein